ncbi:MAG TPA: MFS transporter, partial [Xylella taiwanensis]
FQYVTLIGGQLLAVLTLVILEALFTEVQMRVWGWRIPFMIGAIAAAVALLLRRALRETQSEDSRHNPRAGSLSALFREHRAAFLTVFGYTAGGSLIFYTFTTYMQKFLVNSSGLSKQTSSLVMSCALFVYMCIQPLFGLLSDYIGRRNSMLLFGTLGAVCTVPILATLQRVHAPLPALILIVGALAIVSLYTSISGIVKAEMFPAEIRALGVGFAYAVGNAMFGGSAEYVALGLKSFGLETVFFWYVAAMMVVVFLVSLRLPRQATYLHHDH